MSMRILNAEFANKVITTSERETERETERERETKKKKTAFILRHVNPGITHSESVSLRAQEQNLRW